MFESRSAKTAILASGMGITSLMSLVMTVVLSRWLTMGDYGTYRQAILIYGLAAPLAALGLHNALYYFLVVDSRRTRGVLSENLLLLLMGGGVLAVALGAGRTFLADWFGNPRLVLMLLVIVPYPLFTFVADAVGSCLIARGRAVPVVVYSVLSQVLAVVLTVAFCLIATNPEMAIAGRIVAAAISAVVALKLMFGVCATGSWRPTLRGMKDQLTFSVPLGMATVAVLLNRSVDKLWVSILTTPETYAVYANGAIELPFVGTIVQSITAVLTADFARLYAQRRYREIIELFHRAITKSQFLLLPAMMYVLSVTPELIRLLYTETYAGSAVFFRLYVLLAPVSAIGFNAIFVASGRNRHLLMQSIWALASNAVLSWFAVKWYGPIGGAATLVGVQYLIRVPYLMHWTARILECRWYDVFPWLQLLKLTVASSVGAVLIVAIKPFVQWPDFLVVAVSGVLYAVVTGMCYLFFGLTRVSILLQTGRAILKGQF